MLAIKSSKFLATLTNNVVIFALVNPITMPEILLLCFMMIPQLVAGVYAHSIGESFWFWFFISFLIPIISLIVLLIIDHKKPKEAKEEEKGYQLADHVRKRQC